MPGTRLTGALYAQPWWEQFQHRLPHAPTSQSHCLPALLALPTNSIIPTQTIITRRQILALRTSQPQYTPTSSIPRRDCRFDDTHWYLARQLRQHRLVSSLRVLWLLLSFLARVSHPSTTPVRRATGLLRPTTSNRQPRHLIFPSEFLPLVEFPTKPMTTQQCNPSPEPLLPPSSTR